MTSILSEFNIDQTLHKEQMTSAERGVCNLAVATNMYIKEYKIQAQEQAKLRQMKLGEVMRVIRQTM